MSGLFGERRRAGGAGKGEQSSDSKWTHDLESPVCVGAQFMPSLPD
jgi:hypothetical protein